MDLSIKERISYILQLRILQKLSGPSEYSDYENKITALVNGYKLHYSDIIEELSDEEFPEEDSSIVLDILEMYRGVIYSYLELKKSGTIKTLSDEDIIFHGFDGNEETGYLCYARYFIFDLNRYDEIKEHCDQTLNAHTNTLSTYKEMLTKWKSVSQSQRYHMPEDVIISLLKLGRWMF